MNIVKSKLSTLMMAGYLVSEYQTSTWYTPASDDEVDAKDRVVMPSLDVLEVMNEIARPF